MSAPGRAWNDTSWARPGPIGTVVRGKSRLVRSMTGYGRGVAEQGGYRVVIEVRSVNHRYLDLKLRGASLGPVIEERITRLVRDAVARGSVTLSARVVSARETSPVRVDVAAARRVLVELRRLGELGVGGVDAGLLCAQPGVLVQADDGGADETELADCAAEATSAALTALIDMREAEGTALAADLDARLSRLLAVAENVGASAARAPEEARRRLHERVARLLASDGIAVDRDRLAQEVALIADRLDVTEELVRVRSHIDQAKKMLASSDKAVGRRLDFLVQELGREFNTVTSKSQSADIAHMVVEGKAELEKIREQVQNLE